MKGDHKIKSFDDFKRDSGVKSDSLLEKEFGIKSGLSEEIKQFSDSVEYIKKHFKPKSNRTNVKLSDADVAEIREKWPTEGSSRLAEKFGVSRTCIDKAAKGLTHRHLNRKFKPWL